MSLCFRLYEHGAISKLSLCLFIATSLVFSYNNGGQEREHVAFVLISVLDLIVYFFISNYVPKVLLACSINHISHSLQS